MDSKSSEAEYSSSQLKVHHSISDTSLTQLIEEQVLIEMSSENLLEEIIRTGMPEDDSFTDRDIIQRADDFMGDSMICFGPRLNFHVIENFSSLIEISEDQAFDAFRDFCFEVATSAEVFGPAPEIVLERRAREAELSQIAQMLQEIEARLLQDNDLSPALSREKETLVAEVRLLKDVIAQPRFRPSVLLAMSKQTLGWIGREAGGAVVGGAAMALLAIIAALV